MNTGNFKIRTVADLARHLENQKLSPEAFALKCSISNMTFRRLLAKKPHAPIPQKYWAALDLATGTGTSGEQTSWADFMNEDFDSFAKTLEDEGKGEHDLNKLAEDISLKTKALEVGKKLKELVMNVFDAVRMDQIPKRDKFLAIGALLYFLNPVDLIPDTLPAVGFLDDYAILSMVAAKLASPTRVSEKGKKTDSTEA